MQIAIGTDPPSPLRWMARATWDLVALLLILVVPGRLHLGSTFVEAPDVLLPVSLAMALGYVLARLALPGLMRLGPATPRGMGRLFHPGAVVLAGSLGFGAAAGLLLLVPSVPASRGVAAISVALGLVLLLVASLDRPRLQLAGGAAGALVALPFLGQPPATPAALSDDGRSWLTVSALHGVRARAHPGLVPRTPGGPGGALARLDERLLVLHPLEGLHLVDPRPATGPVSRSVPVGLPTGLPSPSETAEALRPVPLRALDVAVRPVEGGWELVISHHVWDADEGCPVFGISSIRVGPDVLPREEGATWSTLFRSRPCLRDPFPHAQDGYPWLRTGGRLAWLGPSRLLVGVGDHGIRAHGQDPESDYGSYRILDLAGGTPAVEPYSVGHRNPIGLVVADSLVWSTEHGPQGGDELNLLRAGGNYGWASTSLGTDYGRMDFTPEDGDGRADPAHRPPIHAWVPSIGVADLIRVEGRRFHRWSGDLLVASLRDRALHRVRPGPGGVLYVERIQFRTRIRDLEEDAAGRIWLLRDRAALLELDRDDEGNEMFVGCAPCHSTGDWHLEGPGLGGVVGREIASEPSYGYSPALQRMKGRWTPQRLDDFLADPQRYAPGTTMNMEGIPDPAVRARIIEFLAALK